MVANITTCNTLSFNSKELPKDGQNHNRALHVSIKCKEDALARVLIDIGSSLNVMPKWPLDKLSYQGEKMKTSALIGEVELSIQIGPHVLQITFQVMDINPPCSCLLGSPWIHAGGEVTSTLHRKMKFIINNKLIIISGK